MDELVWGVKNGDIDIVKDIIENKKINVNVLISGRAPLHYAADYGQTAVLNYLLDKGANPNMMDKHGISVLLAAIWEGHTDCVKTLLNHKINVNVLISGRAPLHYAADYGQTAVLNYLLDKGANPNMMDKHGISVLLAAIWEGHTDCVKTLLNHGASKDGKTPDGKSYLTAAEKEDIKKLLEM